MDMPSFPERPDPPKGEGAHDLLGRVWRRLPRTDFTLPGRPGRRLLWLAAAAAAALLAHRFLKASFRSVEPGHVGVCVSRLTGSLEALPPGTHFRPRSLYSIHPVRVSDRLLSGPEGTFQVSTQEGVVARLTVQARWAVDRGRLLSTWSALPADPERELVAPVLAAAFRAASPRYGVAKIASEKREELAAVAARRARPRLAESGIVLKDVLIGDLVLPPEYERGRVALVDEAQNAERMEVTLRLKAKEIERTSLEAEAAKTRQIKEAEAEASQRLIAARAEADAMKFVLAVKEKEIHQKKLEAEADKESRVERARADAMVVKIQADAEVLRRKAIADAEAYAIRATSLAQFENLSREAQLVSANPLLIPKTFADRLSENVQVILTPTLGGEAFTDEVLKRAANGQPPVAASPPARLAAVRNASTPAAAAAQ